MAKEETDTKAKKSEKKAATETKAPQKEFKYGVAELAEKLGIEPASVRVALRNKGVEKAGKSYGWDKKEEFLEVVEQLKAGSDKPAKKEKTEKKAEKSAEKKTAKPVEKKAKKEAA